VGRVARRSPARPAARRVGAMTALQVTPVGPIASSAPSRRPKRRTWREAVRRDWQLYSLAVLPIAFFLTFRYLPMIGNVIAFRRYRPGGSILGTGSFSLRYFRLFIHRDEFWHVFWNTVILGGLTLLILFPLPIVLALLLNEVRTSYLKRVVQSVSYLPHFFSIVVVVSMIAQFVTVDGMVNQVVKAFGGHPIIFIQEPGWFRSIFISSEAWQTVGWGTILYLAALTMIDDQLYEAARIDGANRWKQTWHVTLPGIRPTMITLLILNIGTFMGVSFEKVLLLQNPATYDTSDIISTYLFRIFTSSPSLLSYATAIGLFEAAIGLVLIISANLIARFTVGTSLW
jgi:putative aldouronate transport system permease protein